MDGGKKAYTIAFGERYTYFISKQYNYSEYDRIEEGTFLNNTSNNLDPFAYHLEKSGEEVFKQLEYTQIYTYYPNQEEEGEDIWRSQREIEK